MADKTKKKDLHNILKDGFSWKTIGEYRIPYIMRIVYGKHFKYVATRMAEYEVLEKYIINIHSYVYTSCTPVIAYAITESEAKLLNDINKEHYGNGKEFHLLAGKDYIVGLEDLHNFYLIDLCYKKLERNNNSGFEDICFFIRIDSNAHSCVPYYTQNGQKYLALFYFEGDTENLMQRAVQLENWDLAYLKFCWKIQGVKDKFFAIDSCSVIGFDDIKNLYPP
ncbi:unnamed protein product [Macrosiphum euphorbiae]|uniref:GIY-YIG homing endonuclease n=1 Tax=Macrosiphum euphorbiae TaxID=13131 RepID=A0AAV0WZN2_9HEMI|nr:unnamed protein product [Macrosiphum euphorbiae]